MTEETPPPGKTTIAPDVILDIATLTALNTDGVSGMSSMPPGLSRIWKRGHQSDGVRVEIIDNVVNIDLYLILKPEVHVRQVGRKIQKDVARAISEMVGMQPGRINIHIEDIEYEEI